VVALIAAASPVCPIGHNAVNSGSSGCRRRIRAGKGVAETELLRWALSTTLSSLSDDRWHASLDPTVATSCACGPRFPVVYTVNRTRVCVAVLLLLEFWASLPARRLDNDQTRSGLNANITLARASVPRHPVTHNAINRRFFFLTKFTGGWTLQFHYSCHRWHTTHAHQIEAHAGCGWHNVLYHERGNRGKNGDPPNK
jgi:hypothetical protein